jgi:hypothetical protein
LLVTFGAVAAIRRFTSKRRVTAMKGKAQS